MIPSDPGPLWPWLLMGVIFIGVTCFFNSRTEGHYDDYRVLKQTNEHTKEVSYYVERKQFIFGWLPEGHYDEKTYEVYPNYPTEDEAKKSFAQFKSEVVK